MTLPPSSLRLPPVEGEDSAYSTLSSEYEHTPMRAANANRHPVRVEYEIAGAVGSIQSVAARCGPSRYEAACLLWERGRYSLHYSLVVNACKRGLRSALGNRAHIFKSIGVPRAFVGPQPHNTRKAKRVAALVPGARLD